MSTTPSILKSQEAVAITGGRIKGGQWQAGGVSIDTRTMRPGDVFVAIEGEARDGHDFIADAFEKGACAAIVSKDIEGVSGDFLIVDDTLAALQALGKAARGNFGGLTIGVTGSVGKTGTKEMLAACFEEFGQSYASKASYNNHLGVPLSLLNIPNGTDFGIFEMGMNHAGEIRGLTRIARPDIAIITTVEAVHIENFDNVEGIADAKAEIFEGMSPDSIAILNEDTPHLARLKAAAQTQGLSRIYTFGEGAEADGRLLKVIEASNGLRVKADIMGEEVSFTLGLFGRHQAMNALSVILAAKLAGYDGQKAADALGRIEPLAGRGKRESLNYGHPDNPVTLIDESYNSSPVAMTAAFKVLALIDPGRGGRRIAVLGDMLELGNDAPKYHKDLALPLKAANIDFVYTCGAMMKNLHDELPQDMGKVHRESSQELAEIVPDAISPGDVVMVKGSLGSNMQVVVEALREKPKTIANR